MSGLLNIKNKLAPCFRCGEPYPEIFKIGHRWQIRCLCCGTRTVESLFLRRAAAIWNRNTDLSGNEMIM